MTTPPLPEPLYLLPQQEGAVLDPRSAALVAALAERLRHYAFVYRHYGKPVPIVGHDPYIILHEGISAYYPNGRRAARERGKGRAR